ncbi:hypothetical protein B484DRAFT_453766 [Ochromonadaceae sp. CCMP2298]|nr:hypothetical protein B484DRAFT_453766 [Ochromonadaceae sp. CCMP2298]
MLLVSVCLLFTVCCLLGGCIHVCACHVLSGVCYICHICCSPAFLSPFSIFLW